MSESGSGSDVVSMRCRADKQDGCYVLNGTKMWCTNGTVANTLVVYARTEQEKGPHGITAFVIEKGMKVPHVTTHTHDGCCVVAAFCACILRCPPLLNRLQQDLNLVHFLHKKIFCHYAGSLLSDALAQNPPHQTSGPAMIANLQYGHFLPADHLKAVVTNSSLPQAAILHQANCSTVQLACCRASSLHRSWTSWACGVVTPASWSLRIVKCLSRMCWARSTRGCMF